MQGQCKPNAIELARIAEAQPVLAFDNAKVQAFWKPTKKRTTNNQKKDNYLTYIKAIDIGQKAMLQTHVNAQQKQRFH